MGPTVGDSGGSVMAKKRKGPTPKKKPKRHLRLMIISEEEAKKRGIFQFTGEGTTVLFSGSGNVVMECGNCGVPLLDGVPVGMMLGLVVLCPNCGEYNE